MINVVGINNRQETNKNLESYLKVRKKLGYGKQNFVEILEEMGYLTFGKSGQAGMMYSLRSFIATNTCKVIEPTTM